MSYPDNHTEKLLAEFESIIASSVQRLQTENAMTTETSQKIGDAAKVLVSALGRIGEQLTGNRFESSALFLMTAGFLLFDVLSAGQPSIDVPRNMTDDELTRFRQQLTLSDIETLISAIGVDLYVRIKRTATSNDER